LTEVALKVFLITFANLPTQNPSVQRSMVSIIIAGCAGLVVGQGILFPNTFTRLTSFVNGIKAGLKIVISTIPFFIIAGFLEGFVTRHTEMPDWLAICIIVISLALILFYYVIYPIQLHKKNERQLNTI
jgi:undecaprenyl pyrophosphate phosphatase UppP